jgi:hypothetical protein
VFNSLTEKNKTPIHRLMAVARGNQGIERLRLHSRMVNR